MAHDVFISYSMIDKPTADAACATLEGDGCRCWLAPRDLVPGSDWGESIIEAINQSKVLVLIFSSHSNRSPQVKREVERAVNKGLAIIPLRIEDVSPSKSLEYFISSPQWLDALTPPLEKHLRHLANTIRVILSGEEPTPPPPPPPPSPPLPPQRRPLIKTGKVYVLLLGLILVCLAGIVLWVVKSPGPSREYSERLDAFLGALPHLKWIFYDPTEYDPYKDCFPSEASLYKDLETLRRHGFNGLITVSSKQSLRHVPRIAHETGFTMVIAGVWDLRNQEETANAFKAATHVDAFCLGHRGLNKRYTLGELEKWLEEFRAKTNRPVTTSEVLAEYQTNARLIELGDFLFPDVHVLWQQSLTPKEAWDQTKSAAFQAARLLDRHSHKLILLKMVSYPSGGATGFTSETQKEFYRLAVEQRVNRIDIPARVSFSFFAAFDPPWKTAACGWDPPEQCIGLFTAGRQPKPAVTEVDWSRYR
jgi:exo-beta-1,3-glucanase (GH17 family)